MKRAAKLFSRVQADNLVDKLNGDSEEDWVYRACHDPKGTGYSNIDIFDEVGDYVGKL